jgi:hypothetical protein
MNRGDRRERIFADDQDRLWFLETLGEASEKTDWQIHAWCLMQEELDALGWSLVELQGCRKGDPQKVRIAARLQREATMTLAWIADRLCMGTDTHVASLLQRYNQSGANSGETLF